MTCTWLWNGILRHIKNVFAEGELTVDSTVAKFATVTEMENKQLTKVPLLPLRCWLPNRIQKKRML